MGDLSDNGRIGLGDTYCTVTAVRIAEWLRQAPKQSESLEVQAHEIESPVRLWVGTFQEIREEHVQREEDFVPFATFLKSMCEQHAQGQQAECRYSIVCLGLEARELGTMRLRVLPRTTNGQRFTGSMESIVVQLQRHNEALTRKVVESSEVQFAAIKQVVDIQSTTIEKLASELAKSREQQMDLKELAEMVKSEEMDAETRDKMWEVAQQLLPLILDKKAATGV